MSEASEESLFRVVGCFRLGDLGVELLVAGGEAEGSGLFVKQNASDELVQSLGVEGFVELAHVGQGGQLAEGALRLREELGLGDPDAIDCCHDSRQVFEVEAVGADVGSGRRRRGLGDQGCHPAHQQEDDQEPTK